MRTSARVRRWLEENGLKIDVAVAFQPVSQGQGLVEIFRLPQIISAFSDIGLTRVREVFSVLTEDLVEMEPVEAELTKLFTSVWHYIKFAVANQYYMIATDGGRTVAGLRPGCALYGLRLRQPQLQNQLCAQRLRYR